MIGTEGEVIMSAEATVSLTDAFSAKVSEHTEVSVDGMRLFLVNQKRLDADLVAARIEGAERALLERDVEEVRKAIPSMRAHAMLTLRDGLGVAVEARRQKPGRYREVLDREASNMIEVAWLFAVEVVDCQAWLVRARAVLG